MKRTLMIAVYVHMTGQNPFRIIIEISKQADL